MSVTRNILMHMFGHPKGVLGRLGGLIMAHTNEDCGAWVVGLLEIGPNDSVLEVGFGPGVIIQRLSNLASAGHIAGIDPSQEMVEQARARNTDAIKSGRVDLRRGSVETLPFDDATFEKALAVNSMQVWPDPSAGLREMRRVMKPGAKVALGFTPYSGHPKAGLTEILTAAGFTQADLVQRNSWFSALALNP
jgi:ubiquinone/menaquinone biosynthesis C-methylase UbiE